MSTYNQYKTFNDVYSFYIKSSKSGVHFLYIGHLNSEQPHFKCSLLATSRYCIESTELESYGVTGELNLI